MLLTVTQAAEALNCSKATIRAMCKKNKLPYLKAGNRYRIDLEKAWKQPAEENESFLQALAKIQPLRR